VHRRASGTTVSVLEGSVRITPQAVIERPDSAGSTEVPHVAVKNLAMGEEAEIVPKGEIITRQIDVNQAAAWRQHRLVFDNDTLSNIAAEFNRYNRRPRIRIEDAQAGARRFAATFDADAPESLVQVLETNPDLAVEQTDDEIVVRIRKRSSPD
jgi:transmembrane sensor